LDMTDSVRRRLLQGAALSGLAGWAGGLASANAAGHPPAASLNVHDFGARGDGKSDNTAAFQKALDAAHAQGGGTVFAPAGQYLFKGHLTIPEFTTLRGIFAAPPAFVRTQGTVLLPTEGRGNADGPPFLTLTGNTPALQGLAVFYPEQDENAAAPTPYPWTVAHGGGDNLTVLDVALTNPYQGLRLGGAGRHYVARVYGQPLAVGLFVDQCYDVGRIENIHFWPFWTQKPAMMAWVNAHGVGLRFGRTDWEYVLNTFVLGYGIGYHFVETKDGACNGNFVGIGSDASGDALVVEQTQGRCGLLITNGEFVGDARPDSQGMIVRATNAGPVTLQNCAFWGPSDHIGTIQGAGPVTLIGCNFGDWDKNNRQSPAFVLDGGGATLAHCQFLPAGDGGGLRRIARVTENCRSAVIIANTAIGRAFHVEMPPNADPRRFQMGMNVTTE